MRISSAALAALALVNSTASATYIFQYINLSAGVVWAELRTNDNVSHSYGWFLDGCKGSNGFSRETCIDGNKERAHVIWPNGGKTCFKLTKKDSGQNCGGNRCDRYEYKTYTEVACSW
ncbi:hypothetical protein Micbo1qcDRAFT_179904 [Microdochium bolleyi]|uniref:Secreted protein n=1 Tax=Microdochium bolleyi TaxID=196109 RepID=A0A136IN36_9PEZI|nr:hypothetical protein Micbo1qcDRAFT_179904 [Microdochium bolleyi]